MQNIYPGGGQLVSMDIFTCMPGFNTHIANIKVRDVTTCYLSLSFKQVDQNVFEQLHCKGRWGLRPVSDCKNDYKYQNKLKPENDCSLKHLC